MGEQKRGLDSIDQLNYEQRTAQEILEKLAAREPDNTKLQTALELVARGADAGAVLVTILDQQSKTQ